MNDTFQFLEHHGAWVVFGAVFVEQIGLPLPAAPWLLAAGALAGSGKVSGLVALFAAVIGSLLADSIWFALGRRGGRQVLGLLCRISLEPDSCIRKTSNLFTKYGMKGIVMGKFVPGLSTLLPPLAGYAGVTAPRFLWFDGLGSLLYGGSFLLLGALFRNQINSITEALGSLGHGALAVFFGCVAIYIGYKYFERRRLLNDLRMERITVEELRRKQDAGEKVIILDIRGLTELQQDPAMIQGAEHLSLDDLPAWQPEIPHDREVVLYCACPNEVSSAKAAIQLRKRGFPHARPLLGGIDAWLQAKYPTQTHLQKA
ncbi:MAG TPA: DedA family protein/thiosulfate sulfurtransferase GlpE [Verrucomicrobiae bacterium]|nr:DedA family protein/thiosulfate sulfurtransferase GlpE [Verrucomicrobiae bacterium]